MYALIIPYATAVTLTRFSVLLLYKRILPGLLNPKIHLGVKLSMAFSAVWYVFVVIINIFQCHPIAKAWDPKLPGTCLDLQSLACSYASTNLILDLGVNFLVARPLWRLNLPLRRRVVLVVIISMGSL